MKWFREGPSPYQTPLAMIGAKRGQRIVVIGPDSGPIAAEVALVAGLNGHVLVIGRDPAAQAAVDEAAAKAGALLQFEAAASTRIPVDPGSIDIVLLHSELGTLDPADARLAVAETRRVLRAGGRAIVMERTSRPGLVALIRGRAGHTPPFAPDHAIDLLKTEGFLAVRLLADAEGTAYVEGRR